MGPAALFSLARAPRQGRAVEFHWQVERGYRALAGQA